ncbi:hypothetical protein [uncultured Methylobacterium sp.]|uniref:hypothetical protein n=1 Tax=uncultured Methylobacterium sp. TaxID=157278 RepID=UPI0035CB1A8B
MGHHDTNFDAAVATRTLQSLKGPASALSRRRAYGQAAFATAIDDGLMPDEVRQILAGRRIVDAFPVRWGESVPAYAARTVAEMMVAYLRAGPFETPTLGAATAG